VSSDRTIQITQRADFPPPTDTPGIGSAWCIKDVTAWAERTGRTLQWDALTGEISVDRQVHEEDLAVAQPSRSRRARSDERGSLSQHRLFTV